ncbi:MAG TPA: ABC transporter ATP-binding protein [Allosphingosinicella sp.]|nr:ABC transporter ATP-binding protein [Allosphingosinicella sp.]
MTLAAPLISISNVSKLYRRGKEEIPIFTDLSLQIGRGEFLALMGPSGSGKTTLLNLIGGIDRITDGRICFDGERIDEQSEVQFARWRAAHVGFVFQFYNLIPVLTAAQNVELPLLLARMSKQERSRRVALALDIVGLADRAKHLPRELSGGQQQRVAIGRALVSDPELILADEPTGDLDRETGDEVLGILKLLSDTQGKTVVMVTHDPRAATYASRVLHLDKGDFVRRDLAA